MRVDLPLDRKTVENQDWATGPPGHRAAGCRAAGPPGRRAAGPWAAGGWAFGPLGRPGPWAAGRWAVAGRGPAFSKTRRKMIVGDNG